MIHYCYIILRNVEGKKSLSFLPPWEFQTLLSLGTPRLPINLPRKWLSHNSVWRMRGSFHRPSDQASCFPCCPFHLLFMRLSVEIKSHQRVRVHNSIANASKGVLFLPPSDVYVRSFLYLFYTLIKTLLHKSSEWSSLISGPRLNSSPPEAKNPRVFRGSATTFQSFLMLFVWWLLLSLCLFLL